MSVPAAKHTANLIALHELVANKIYDASSLKPTTQDIAEFLGITYGPLLATAESTQIEAALRRALGEDSK